MQQYNGVYTGHKGSLILVFAFTRMKRIQSLMLRRGWWGGVEVLGGKGLTEKYPSEQFGFIWGHLSAVSPFGSILSLAMHREVFPSLICCLFLLDSIVSNFRLFVTTPGKSTSVVCVVFLRD